MANWDIIDVTDEGYETIKRTAQLGYMTNNDIAGFMREMPHVAQSFRENRFVITSAFKSPASRIWYLMVTTPENEVLYISVVYDSILHGLRDKLLQLWRHE